ncbi:MAG: hypothetical protein AB7O13_03230 [Alphaproteobacteria bacterium]
MNSRDSKDTPYRSTQAGKFVTAAKPIKGAATVLREGRTARVASALSKANRATGLLGRDGATRRILKK